MKRVIVEAAMGGPPRYEPRAAWVNDSHSALAAMHWPDTLTPRWNVTIRATGMGIPFTYCDTRKEALALAARLEELGGWQRAKRGAEPGIVVGLSSSFRKRVSETLRELGRVPVGIAVSDDHRLAITQQERAMGA